MAGTDGVGGLLTCITLKEEKSAEILANHAYAQCLVQSAAQSQESAQSIILTSPYPQVTPRWVDFPDRG